MIRTLLKSIGVYRFVISSRPYRRLAGIRNLRALKRAAADKGLAIGARRNGAISIAKGDREIRMSPRQMAYCFDIIQGFDYFFAAVKPVREDGLLVVDYSKPGVHVLAAIDLPFHFTSLAESSSTTGIYLDKAGLREGDIVLDLGAYCGVSTWAFSRAVGNRGRVYAYEPDRENFQALSRNVERHSLKNVIPVNRGVWSAGTRLSFQGEGNMGSGVVTLVGRRSNVYEVEVVSLDDIGREHGLSRVDFVKMDIEGSEVEVLRSAGGFISRYRPRMVIEAHLLDGELTTELVCKILAVHGYHCEIMPQPGASLPLIYAVPATGAGLPPRA